jgi:hypothetical protein
MIVKNVIGTLEVDPRSKTIWLNSLGRCVLRLSKLNFLDVNEKFSIIDGTPTGIYFHRDPEVEDSEKFMPNIISLVVSLISMVQENKIQDSKFFEEIERTISRMVNKSLEVKNMSILSDLLSELTSSDSDETLKKLCDKIYDQEVKHINHPTILPSGPNIFLALECPDDFQKYNFICLEREERNTFIVSHWGVMKDSEHPKRIRVWDCRSLPNNKIIEQFLEKYNFLRGK